MSISAFSYTKDWTNPDDFPTVETSEEQVRADIQLLYDEAKDKINEIIGATNSLESEAIYPAEEGTTTISQLVSAYAAGNPITCESDGITYYMNYYEQDGSTYTFGFWGVEGTTIKRIAATGTSSSTTWSSLPDIDLSSFAPLASPTFTGVPKAPTATAGTNTTQIATCAFVQSAVAGGGGGGGGDVTGVKGDAEANYRTGNVNLTPANLGAQPKITANGILKGNGSGTISAAVAGTDYAAASHNHDASAITSGTLSVARGGTGASSFTSGELLVGNGTGAVTTKGIRNNTSVNDTIPENTAIPTSNTLRYAINRTTSVAAADTNYTTYMARGEALNSTDTNPTANGTISWTYA